MTLHELRERDRAAQHDHDLTHNPVVAHWNAAACATGLGCFMALARGAVVAIMQPRGLRLSAFLGVSRAAAPFYVVPFVLGTQLDCYWSQWESRGLGHRSSYSSDASDLG